jgi:hypothetical protein
MRGECCEVFYPPAQHHLRVTNRAAEEELTDLGVRNVMERAVLIGR